VNPLGIDATAPRLSWAARSDQRGQIQSAYRILVACDVSDVGGHHITLGGGTANAEAIEPAGHFAVNNHLMQTVHDGGRGVRIRGVGNIFRHNLIHNFLGLESERFADPWDMMWHWESRCIDVEDWLAVPLADVER
jgi:hypothetical protein